MNTVISILITFVCISVPAAAKVVIENVPDGTTVNHPVLLVIGRCAPNVENVNFTNSNSKKKVVHSTIPYKGRFKALVRLVEGENKLHFKESGDEGFKTVLVSYKKNENPKYVRIVWFTDKSGNSDYLDPRPKPERNHTDRLRTAAELMQTFMAEQMNRAGFGYKTFRLERDDQGKVVVHELAGDHDLPYYHGITGGQLYAETGKAIRTIADPNAKNLAIIAVTRKNLKSGATVGHTALGGGQLSVFGSGSIYSWPESISVAQAAFMNTAEVDPRKVHKDDGRSVAWGLASTTIGASLHELGHALGLPHCKDSFSIMTRGFGHLNRTFTVVEPLNRSFNRKITEFTTDKEARITPGEALFLSHSAWMNTFPGAALRKSRIEVIDQDNGIITIRSALRLKCVRYRAADDFNVTVKLPDEHIRNAYEFDLKKSSGTHLNGSPLISLTVIDEVGSILHHRILKQAEQDGAGQPATAPKSKSEGDEKH